MIVVHHMKIYRFASPAPAIWNLIKTFVLVGGFAALFLVKAPLLVARLNHHPRFAFFILEPQVEAAYVVCGIAGLVALWAMLTVAFKGKGTPMPFDAPRKLVITGPYAWMRNPLLASGIGMGLAATLYTGALLILPCVVVGMLACQMIVWTAEKSELEREFGRDFEAYRRSVRYWLPMRRRWTPERRDGRPISLDEIDMSPRLKRRSS
jgi:protein-S-isoprenylcysteine O-methyltransferase Ste14